MRPDAAPIAIVNAIAIEPSAATVTRREQRDDRRDDQRTREDRLLLEPPRAAPAS